MGAVKFEYAYDLSGCTYPVIREFNIATNTVIEKGEVVKLVEGFVVAVGDTDQDDPYLGVSVEEHDGTTAGRESGTRIKVYCSPTAVFKCKPNIVSTADSGNATTWVDAEVGAVANDKYNGGILKLTEKAAASTLTAPVGYLYKVTDFATSTGTFTGTFTGNVSAGDKALILPPVGSFGWDLNANGTNLDTKANGGESIIIVDVDTENEWVYWKLRLHQFGDYPIAV